MIRIKVCGMTDPLNVKEISEIRPDFLGFIFYPGSPRYVGKDPDRSLFLNLPRGTGAAGVFVNEKPETVIEIAKSTGLEIIQLHGSESPSYCSRLRSSGLTIVKAFCLTQDFDFKTIESFMVVCDYFLFDTKTEVYGGSGRKFNWELLKDYSLGKSFFLSGGIGPDDACLIKTIESNGLFGVDINSRFENAPGIKNVRLVKTFIDTLKNDIV